MQLRIVFPDLVIDEGIDMFENGAGEAVGDAGDKMSSRSAGFKHISHIRTDFLFRGIRPVNCRADPAHQDHPAVQLTLQSGNIIFRQHTLPALDADFGHVVYNRSKIRVGMVDGDHALGTDIAVNFPVGLLEELTPHIRVHEEIRFGAPVIVEEDTVRVHLFAIELHDLQFIFADIINQLMHLVRMLIEVGERVFKTHQKVALLKQPGAGEGKEKPVRPRSFPRGFDALFPAFLTVGFHIGSMHDFFPLRDVFEDFKIFCGDRLLAGMVLGPGNRDAPAILPRCARAAPVHQVSVYRVKKPQAQGLVLVEQPVGLAVRLQHFKEYLFGSHGNLLFYGVRMQDVNAMVPSP